MNFFLQNKKVNAIIVIVFTIWGLFLFGKGPIISPDSTSYLNMEIIRGPIYPLFLKLFKIIFGENNFIFFIYIFQIILNIIIIIYFNYYVFKRFKLNPISYLILSLSFLYPIYKVSSGIITEALAFPLFFLYIMIYLEYFFKKNNKLFIIKLFILILLILIRTQFLFIIPVIIFLEFYIMRKKITKIKFFFHISLVLLVLFSTTILDKIYHYFYHNYFISTPFTGIQLVTEAFYVSDTTDYKFFYDKNDKLLVREILDSAYTKNLIYTSVVALKRSIGTSKLINHYNESYNDLCHRTIKPIIFNHINVKDNVKKWALFDKKTIKIAFVLIKNNFKKFVKLYILDIVKNCFINYYNLFIYFAMLLIILIYSAQDSYIKFLLILSFLFCLSNLLLIALVEPVLPRYTIYTNVLLGTTLIIILDKFLGLIKNTL